MVPRLTLACGYEATRSAPRIKLPSWAKLTQIGAVIARSVKVVLGMLLGSPAADAELSMAMGAIKARRELKRMLKVEVTKGGGWEGRWPSGGMKDWRREGGEGSVGWDEDRKEETLTLQQPLPSCTLQPLPPS